MRMHMAMTVVGLGFAENMQLMKYKPWMGNVKLTGRISHAINARPNPLFLQPRHPPWQSGNPEDDSPGAETLLGWQLCFRRGEQNRRAT